jgi:hypothetical protein
MDERAHLAEMQRYVAGVAITPSALRKLGAKGLVASAQDFLGNIPLEPLASMDSSDYPHWLAKRSGELEGRFQKLTGREEGFWGPARKSVNIFMVMASLNRFLCAEYALDRLVDAFEVPLDNIVAKNLLEWAKGKGKALPAWEGIKWLDKENSEKSQELAAELAKEKGIRRSHLDVVFMA